LNIREQARAVGGDKLVAIIDAAQEVEKDVFEKLTKVMEEKLIAVVDDHEKEKAVLAALCEAFSQAYAHVVAITTIKSFDGNRAEGILIAVKSVSGNITCAFDTLDAGKADILGKIRAAAAKGSK
jgi:hypothetical protein